MSVNGLRPYPAYRDSGADWLGRVPEHWEVRRLKTRVRNAVDPTRSACVGEFLVLRPGLGDRTLVLHPATSDPRW